jgi:tellurite resistance protein
MTVLIKGQATTLDAKTVQLEETKGIVVLPDSYECKKPLNVFEDNAFIQSGKLDLSKFDAGSKIKLVAEGISSINLSAGGVDFLLNKKSSSKYWLIGEFYNRNGQFKFRFLDDGFNEISVLADWCGYSECSLQEAFSFEKKLGENLVSSASKLINSSNTDELTSNAKSTLLSLKSEGLSLFNKLKGRAQKEVKNFTGTPFLKASVSVAALIAYADGYASQDEEAKLLDFVKSTDALASYELNDVKREYNEIVNQLKLDKIVGSGKAYTNIVKFKDKAESTTLIALGISVANVENGIDDDEKAVLKKVISSLGESEDLYSEYL